MKTRLLSVLLIFLLVATVSIPAVSADSIDPFIDPFDPSVAFFPPANEKPVCQFAVVNPITVKLAFDGIAFLTTSAVVMEIGNHLGKTWDGTVENLQKFASDVGAALNKLFAAPNCAPNWVDITSNEGKALMIALYDCYTAPSGDGGKKDDKWYLEARLNHGKIEINTNRMDETQAVKEMGRGKNIMTLNKEMAQNLVGRFKGLTETATKGQVFEGTPDPAAGNFLHLHYYAKNMRLHCWSWK